MATLSRKNLESILTSRLGLRNPLFVLEKVGPRLSGSVISATFNGMRDQQRQQMIWDALEAEFGAGSIHLVGTLLAYTPAEWEIDLEPVSSAQV